MEPFYSSRNSVVMNSDASLNTPKTVRRNFMSYSIKQYIIFLLESQHSPQQISKMLCLNQRQVHNFAKEHRKGQKNVFTREEDEFIIERYSEGLTKPSELCKHITTKAPWMIRNRIKYLKRNNLLTKLNSSQEIVRFVPDDPFSFDPRFEPLDSHEPFDHFCCEWM